VLPEWKVLNNLMFPGFFASLKDLTIFRNRFLFEFIPFLSAASKGHGLSKAPEACG